MPTSAEHGGRVKRALRAISKISNLDEPIVTEYFYAALHMFEAFAHDFSAIAGDDGFDTHQVRCDVISKFNAMHPLHAIKPFYSDLYDLSRRSRYLVIRAKAPVAAVKPKDVARAAQCCNRIRECIEIYYKAQSKPVPWVEDSTPAAAGSGI